MPDYCIAIIVGLGLSVGVFASVALGAHDLMRMWQGFNEDGHEYTRYQIANHFGPGYGEPVMTIDDHEKLRMMWHDLYRANRQRGVSTNMMKDQLLVELWKNGYMIVKRNATDD